MKFTLRPFTNTDLTNLVKYANNRNVAKNLTDRFPFPYTEKDGKQFISMVSGAKPSSVLAIEVNGKFSGAIGIHPQTDIWYKNAELGYWLAEPFWGKGIITEAVKQMVEYGFGNFEIDRIYARPFGSNIGSQKVLEKAGFVLEGRFEKTIFKYGEYQDELVYAVRR